MSSTVVLISGANRGLGLGYVERYLAKPNHIVIGTVRDPENASSKALFKLPAGTGSSVIVVKVDSTVEPTAAEAVRELTTKHGIDHIDIVIANAGVAYAYPKVSELKTADFLGHVVPNVLGVVWLFQATLPLLQKAQSPKWATIGSTAGALENQVPITNAAYSPSKTAVHWLTKKMNTEEEYLTAFVISPGWVQTEMGNFGAKAFGIEHAPLGIKESCDGVVALVDSATKETHGGGFWGHDGEKLAW